MQRQWALTDLEMVDLGTLDVDGYEGKDGSNANGDAVEEALQADDGSTQNVEH